MAIHRPKDRHDILRLEIAIYAESVADRTTSDKRLIELLQELNPEASRAVVFVTSRHLAEELAIVLRRETGLAAAPFHAGLSPEVRATTYQQFRDGDLCVLCATKAFGMGMDIDNIHLVVHFGPPSSLEDYVQEIGRAAREAESLRRARLERAQAWLLYEPGDFRKMQDRLKDGLLSPLDLQALHDLLVEEWKRAGSPSDEYVSIRPERLANRLRSGSGTANQVRIGLYWLEKLGRIKVGFYAPAQIRVQIDLTQVRTARSRRGREAKRLLDYLRSLSVGREQQIVNFQARDAIASADLSSQDQLFIHLEELVRGGAVQYLRGLLLPLADRRAQESRGGAVAANWPLLNAALAAARMLGDDLDLDAERTYTRGELKQRLEAVAAEHFRPEEFTWLEAAEREERTQCERRDFPRCVFAVLRLLQGLRIVWLKQELDSDGLRFRLNLRRKDWDQWLAALPALAKECLRNIVAQEQSREASASGDVGEIDAQQLLTATLQAAEPHGIGFSVSHLQVILRFLRGLGYLRRTDLFVPMALDVQVTDPSPIDLDETSKDAAVLGEFKEQGQLRMLRLAALETLPALVDDVETLRKFVEEYFEAASPQALLTLLGDNLPAGDDILRQLREEALIELLEGDPARNKPGLSDQQRAVYDAPLDRHLMVIAGPGAGKTHTLLARLVRLVHKENVKASEILVLAFTRAVVSELRYRLQDLLGRLGYGGLARSIQVTTFHSFVLGTLREFHLLPDNFRLDDKDWFEEFERLLRGNPSLRQHMATRYRYVLVDEFQDVHGARYGLLEYLAASGQTYLLVVGDDDQSIYDYERARGEGNSVEYFHRFAHRFEPIRFDLTLNYRSARTIVEFSQGVIAMLPDRLKGSQALLPCRPAQGVAEWRETGTDLVALLREVKQNLKALSDRRSQHDTVAILARTNRDVYRIKSYLQQKMGDRFSVLVQGEESRFVERRDVAEVVDVLRDQHMGQRARGILELLGQELSRPQFRKWLRNQPPERHELWYLAQEFLAGAGQEATIADFIAYVREISHHGNYLRVVARSQATGEGPGQVLLSTIHKVKGIEFPAVILFDSDMKVDCVDLELRAMYVGMTRAEDILIALRGEREERLLQRRTFEPTEAQRCEIVVAPSLGDVFISKFGYEWDNQQFVETQVRPGDEITLVRNRGSKNPYSIMHNDGGRCIGLLSGIRAEKSDLTRELMRRFGDVGSFSGLEVTGVYRRYTEHDKDGSYYDRLCDKVKDQGYYYVVEIGGLVRPG